MAFRQTMSINEGVAEGQTGDGSGVRDIEMKNEDLLFWGLFAVRI
jgi:hypothetical protein